MINPNTPFAPRVLNLFKSMLSMMTHVELLEYSDILDQEPRYETKYFQTINAVRKEVIRRGRA